MKTFYQSLLILGFATLGLILGTFIGGKFFVAPGSGLAGPAIALGYGVLGMAILAFLGFWVSRKLQPTTLKRAALLASFALIATAGLLVYRFYSLQEARKDPDSAYAGLPKFTLTVEQIIILDPYLRTKIELDSEKRRWDITLPDKRQCRGTMRAKEQKRIAEALVAFSQLPEEQKKLCVSENQKVEQRLTWHLLDTNESGVLELSEECASSRPELKKLLIAIGRANLSPTSRVTCD